MGLVIIITFLLTSYFWAFVFYMISKKERQRRDAYRPIGYYTSIEVDEQGLIVKGVITDKEIKKKLKD
jgi:hypothetical protein